MNAQETRLLLTLTVTSLLMLAVSLWMAWSVWREVRRLVARVGDHMDGLIRKQTEVLQEVAGVTAAGAEAAEKAESPPAAESGGSSDG
ncbi:MAG: hypothetical protein JO166_02360 [Deltaproteobacteria bacterium]|nr:hypothetical protein [Deltaproteobacteria bacterium]